jgi:glucose-6-phosphate dehydrogenase assembly protein OpcA
VAPPLSAGGPEAITGPAASWEGTGVSVAEIAARLSELRDRAAAGRPHGRSTLLNLVVWAPSAEDAAVSGLLDTLVGPSRIIVLSPGAETGIGARLEVHAHPGAIAQDTVCEELVRLTLGPDVAAHAASVVTPLVRGDLTTFVWWPGPPEPALPAYRDLAGLADRLITEADRGLTGPDALAVVMRELAERDAAITDLSWAALTPWRQLVAQMLRPEQVGSLRRGPSVARMVHGEEPPTLEALLLAGWLRDVIGETLRVELHAAPAGAAAIARLDLEGPEGRRLRVERVPDSPSCAVTVDAPGTGTRRRTLPLRVQSRRVLIAGELEIRSHDRSFERAATCAQAVLR